MSYFYHDKPVFGLDIGRQTVKVMQLDSERGNKCKVVGYGVVGFSEDAIVDGVIVDPEAIAKATHELFGKRLIGHITTRRTAVALPASRTFTRTVTLPTLNKKDLEEALRLEAEQYIPMPIEDLHIDHEIISQDNGSSELLVVAIPKKIVDSYMDTVALLGLEAVAFETNINATSRIFTHAEQNDVPTILIDFGSVSSDITIYDEGLIVTGTIPGGGENLTHLIAQGLKVTEPEAHVIKTKYGLNKSKKQKEITQSIAPILRQLLNEIRRMIRYYEERSDSTDNKERRIGQVVTMGGGANMPGLSEYMTDALRLPVRSCDPWHYIDFDKLQPPNRIEKSMYITASGLALLNPKEVFA